MSGSEELLERLEALQQDVIQHIQTLREGVESLCTQLASCEHERKTLREQRESLETQIMDMIDEFDDPTFPDNIRYFPGTRPDGVA